MGVDPAAVAAFYQAKGYSVHEGARVPGLSGNEHRVPLLAEGPLGSLAIFFGDFGGVDGPEMGGARKAARDIGATPVLAADGFTNNDRQVAARLGVVLLDGSMMTEDAPPADPAPPQAAWPGLQVRPRAGNDEPDRHPWPASGRVGGRDGPAARAIDIDDLLADTRRPAAREAPEPAAMEPALEAPLAAAARAEVAGAGSGRDDDGEALWRRPRSTATATATATPAAAMVRRPGRFAWLGADAGTTAAGRPGNGKKSGADGKGSGFTVDYDDVVPARAPRPADEAARLGDEPDLQPTVEQLERREKRSRWQRRLFWALFAFVFLYLVYLWWP